MNVLGVLVGIFIIIFYLLVLFIVTANYIMTSIGYYTLAKRRLINNCWLAWIPVAREWIIGKLADEYDERNGHERNWRTTLLVTSLLVAALVVIMYIAIIVMTVVTSYGGGVYDDDTIFVFIGTYASIFVLAFAASAYEVCSAICLFKIYESTESKKAVKYIILSMIVPLAHGICMLKVKNSGYDYELYTETAECAGDTLEATECDCLPCETQCEDSEPALEEVPEVTDSETVEE